MRYELTLRVPPAQGALTRERASEALAAQGFTLDPAAGALGEFPLDREWLRADPATRAGWDAPGVAPAGPPGAPPYGVTQGRQGSPTPLTGLTLSFPLDLAEAQTERALAKIFDLQETLQAELFDPQLGALCKRADTDRVLLCWRRHQAFQVGVAGNLELTLTTQSTADEPARGWGGIPRLLLVVGLLLLGLLAARSCLPGGG